LQCVAVCCTIYELIACCSVLNCVAVCCSVSQCVVVCCTIYELIACCSVLKCVAVCCSVLHHLRTYRVLQCAQVCCSVLYLLQTYRATVTERYTIPNSNPRVSKVPYLFPKKPYIMSHERTFCELIALLLQHAVLT